MHQTGRHEAALPMIAAALTRNPSHPYVLNTCAAVLTSLGRLDEALASYDRAVATAPDYAAAWANRGDLLAGLDRHADALASFDCALIAEPANQQAAYGRAEALARLDRHAEAVAAYDGLLAREPEFGVAHFGRGRSLLALSRYDESAASFATASRCHPDSVEAQVGQAGALFALRRFREASSVYDQILMLHLDNADAHFNQGLCHLALGDFARGWRGFEWRWQTKYMRDSWRDFGVPQWRGGVDIAGKTLLLHAEQGFGDVLQFCRYAPLVAAEANVVLEVPPPLGRLFTRLAGRGQLIAKGDALPKFDLHCPLLSLPLAFNTTLQTIPGTTPYLAADPLAVAGWQKRLSGVAGLHVGLCWAGSPRHEDLAALSVDRRRSIALAQYAPLNAVAGVSFVSLQKGEAATQTAASSVGLPIHDWTDELHDFADTAALIEALDLVITVDTAVAHLAGALAKPVWILNRFDACWRWLIDRDDSPWYPTARLFRQPAPGDWDGVIADVCKALTALVSHRDGRA
jgi:tetratricopeptide (TPR) repeat protein